MMKKITSLEPIALQCNKGKKKKNVLLNGFMQHIFLMLPTIIPTDITKC